MHYIIFPTLWGWTGLAGEEQTVKRLVLPSPSSQIVKDILFHELGEVKEEPNFLPDLVQQIIDYFNGKKVEEWRCLLDLSHYSSFGRRVLEETIRIPYGTVITYGGLAQKIGQDRAARAVGQALGKNRIPLLIPCHRVVSSRNPGGYTAPGGVAAKLALINLEQKSCQPSAAIDLSAQCGNTSSTN